MKLLLFGNEGTNMKILALINLEIIKFSTILIKAYFLSECTCIENLNNLNIAITALNSIKNGKNS